MFTVVTALYDIGREQYEGFSRKFDLYLSWLKNFLNLKVDLIIFCEEKTAQICRQIPRENKTTIIVEGIDKLYMWQYRERMIKIHKDPNYLKGFTKLHLPEVKYTGYSLLMLSKAHFMKRALSMTDSPFLVWMDAGFSHGTIDMRKINFNPINAMINFRNKITVIGIKDSWQEFLKIPNDIDCLEYAKVNPAHIGGNFMLIHRDLVETYHKLFYEIVEEILNRTHKDDDQVILGLLAKRYPDMFNIIVAGWYDGLYVD